LRYTSHNISFHGDPRSIPRYRLMLRHIAISHKTVHTINTTCFIARYRATSHIFDEPIYTYVFTLACLHISKPMHWPIHTLACLYIGMSIYWHAYTPACLHIGMPIHWHAQTLACQHTGMPIHWHAYTQARLYIGMPIWRQA
jgi:hypothetical protein